MSVPLAGLVPALPPRHPLGQFPSPLENHPELAADIGLAGLAVKREDQNGTPFGGNKLRALEFLLPTLGKSVVTIGGYGSTWCAALSAGAALTGRSTYPVLFPQPWNETVAGTLSTTLRHGEPVLAWTKAALPIAATQAWWRARRIGPPSWLGAGGASPLSVLGSVNAALELVAQVDGSDSPRPDAVIVPCGSCGTAAGLLLGFSLARWPVTVCAVRAAEPWYATERRVLALARRAHDLLRRSGMKHAPALGPLRLITDELGAGYGHPTPAARRAQRWMAGAGLTVDLTYTAKAAAALARLGASFPRLLFWHTFDTRLVHTPVLDHPLLHRAHLRAESLWPHQKLT